MECKHIRTLGLSEAHSQRSGMKVHVSPRQAPQVALAKSRPQRSEIPRLASTLARHSQQPRQFLIRERTTHAPPVGTLALQRHHLQRVAVGAPSLHTPTEEGNRVLPCNVHRSGRQAAIRQAGQVPHQRVGVQLCKPRHVRPTHQRGERETLSGKNCWCHAGMFAVSEVCGHMLRERATPFDCVAFVPRINHAFAA